MPSFHGTVQEMTRLALVLVLVPGYVLAAPEPSPVPSGWNLTFHYQDPQRVEVSLPGRSAPTTFWYQLYTVVNTSGQDVMFMPRFELMTASGTIIPSEQGVSARVFAAICERHAKDRPLLQSPAQIIGRLLQGEDNARDGVAIWPDFSAKADKFTVYVAGLSQEARQVANPAYQSGLPETVPQRLADGTTVPAVANPRMFTLHRTLAMRYDLPGDVRTRAGAVPVRTGQEWVMR